MAAAHFDTLGNVAQLESGAATRQAIEPFHMARRDQRIAMNSQEMRAKFRFQRFQGFVDDHAFRRRSHQGGFLVGEEIAHVGNLHEANATRFESAQ